MWALTLKASALIRHFASSRGKETGADFEIPAVGELTP
jgi:hypothetical protein